MTKSNHTSLVSDLLDIAQAKSQVETGGIYLCNAHYNELATLSLRLIKRADDEKARTIIVNYWQESSPDGEKFADEFNKLKETEKRTPAQDTRFRTMQMQLNAINTALERAVKTYNGVAYLKSRGCAVTYEQDKKSKGTWSCFVKAKDEQDRVFFNASQLMKIEEAKALLDKHDNALDMRGELKSLKQGTPNVNKGGANGTRIEPSKVADAVTNLDTTLAGLVTDGGSYAVGPDAKAKLRALWMQLDNTLTDAEKQLARDEHAKLAAPVEKKVPNVVTKIKAAVTGK